MGELRGGRPDVPPEEPDRPSGDRVRAPEPATDSNDDPRAIREAFRRAEDPAFGVEVRYVTDRRPDTGPASLGPYRTSKDRPEPEPKPEPVDGPTHRAPDIEPPSGDELLQKDAPGASRLDRARKKFFEAENLDNEQSKIHDWGELFQGSVLEKPQDPPSIKCESRPPQPVSETPHAGIDGGDTLTSMFVAGILLGEGIRAVYRKTSEPKENLHARNG